MLKVQRGDPVDEKTLVTLLQLAQKNAAPQAFDGLYLLFADRVFRFLLSRSDDPDLADEVTSQVFVRLIEKVDMYRIAEKDNAAIFSAWLYRMAYNKMIDVIRANKRTNSNWVDLEYAENVADSNVLEVVDLKIEFELVMQKMQLLNEQQRDVLILRFVEDLSIAETAQIMQKSEGAIKALQHRALETLRRLLRYRS
jgi:RNA polymerase sigma-70 factor, ECF subfamily